MILTHAQGGQRGPNDRLAAERPKLRYEVVQGMADLVDSQFRRSQQAAVRVHGLLFEETVHRLSRFQEIGILGVILVAGRKDRAMAVGVECADDPLRGRADGT